MSETLIRKENWKSDIRLAVTLTLAGEPIAVPNHAFTLRFSVCNGRVHYDCYRSESGEFVNCKPSNDNSVVLCFLDNHKLGLGDLHCEYYDYAPDSDFADGNKLTVVPQVLPIKLVKEAGDDGELLDVEIVADINGAISDANAAAAAANAAAAAANLAASRAETATGDAESAATSAESAASSANAAAIAANAAAVRANDAADAAVTIATNAANSATEAANLAADAAMQAERKADAANDAANAATSAASYARDCGDNAQQAANAANAAADRANAIADEFEHLPEEVDVLGASVTLANYAGMSILSEGVNEYNKGITISFEGINELTVYYGDDKLTKSIANGSTVQLPNGYGWYYGIDTGALYVLPIDVNERPRTRYEPLVCLAEVNRGLIVGGKLLDALTDYRIINCAHFVDCSFIASMQVGDHFTSDQIEMLLSSYSLNIAIKVNGIVGYATVQNSIGYSSMTVRCGQNEVVLRFGIQDGVYVGSIISKRVIPDAVVLTQSDFDEICI